MFGQNLPSSQAEPLAPEFSGQELTTTVNWALSETSGASPIVISVKDIFRFNIQGDIWKIPFHRDERIDRVLAEIQKRSRWQVQALFCNSKPIPPHAPIGHFKRHCLEVTLQPKEVSIVIVMFEDGMGDILKLQGNSVTGLWSEILGQFPSKFPLGIPAAGILVADRYHRLTRSDPIPPLVFCWAKHKTVDLRVTFPYPSGDRLLKVPPVLQVLRLLAHPDVLDATNDRDSLIWIDGTEYTGTELICALAFRKNPPSIAICYRWNIHFVTFGPHRFKFELPVGLSLADFHRLLSDRFRLTRPFALYLSAGMDLSPDWVLAPHNSASVESFRVDSCISRQKLSFRDGDIFIPLEFAVDATVADVRNELAKHNRGYCEFFQDGRPVFKRDGPLSEFPLRPGPIEVRFRVVLTRPPRIQFKPQPPVEDAGCSCTVILPDHAAVQLRVRTVREAFAEAIAGFSTKPGTRYGILSADFIILGNDFEIKNLREPRDLFLQEVLDVSIHRRNPDRVICTCKCGIESPLANMESKIGAKLSTALGFVPDPNICHRDLNHNDYPLFAVDVKNVKAVLVRDMHNQEFLFEFDSDARISDLKTFLEARRCFPSGFYLLNASNSEPPRDCFLRDADQEIHCIHPSSGEVGDDPGGPKARYRFKCGNIAAEVELGDTQTVREAKDILAKRIGSRPESISLIYNRRMLNDRYVLSRQRIRPGTEIAVLVRDNRAILIESSPGICPDDTQ
jgi:hypothetical protein